MKKVKLLTSLAVILSLIMVPCTALAVPINEERCESIISEQNYHGIDMGIWNLNYDRNAVLSNQGESVESFVPKSGSEVNGKFVVVEKNKKSLSTTPVDISIIDSITDRTYPGALQLADKGFLENRPTLLMSKRKPMDISIDLPGMASAHLIGRVVIKPQRGDISINNSPVLFRVNQQHRGRTGHKESRKETIAAPFVRVRGERLKRVILLQDLCRFKKN